MSEWKFVQLEPGEQFAQLHHFSFKHNQGDREVEFLITVKEHFNPPKGIPPFFAQADKFVYQSGAPFQPSGWGPTLLTALSDCIRAIRKFPYEGE